jgi:CRP/FNR family transcriptional regulator, cyclic AMP receptor protein
VFVAPFNIAWNRHEGFARRWPRRHKIVIVRRHGTAIIAGGTAAIFGGYDMAETSVDFGILAGAGAPLREFKAGEVIFKLGDPASEFFVIQSGKVDIRLGNRLLGTLSDHDIFGEMALIDAAPRSATAIAASDVKLVPVAEKQFLFLVSRTHFALNIMRVLARRLRATNSAI